MDHNEPIYELNVNWDWAHEDFFKQRFVGKRLSREPYAKEHHVTFTDGTTVAATNSDRNKAYHVNKDNYECAGIIEHAWIDTENTANDTHTQRLYVQCENEDEPRLLAEATFTHEIFEDWDALYLIAFDEDEW